MDRITAVLDQGVTTTYGFDNIDQLISETRSGYAATYTYDANGNRTQRVVNGVSESYFYDDADKLTSITSTLGNRSFVYDALGRMTSRTEPAGTTNYTWTIDSRLASISGPSVSNSFGYSVFGARVSQTGTGGTKTFKRAGFGVTSPLLSDGQATYTPGVSERRAGVSTWSHSGIKNNALQTGASGALSGTRRYDAYGNLSSSTGTWSGPFGYGGPHGYQEDASGLRLLGHRYYDPSIGRFISQDPIGAGSNWYQYAANSPIWVMDPFGLDIVIIGKTGGFVGLFDGFAGLSRFGATPGSKIMSHPTKREIINALIAAEDGANIAIWGHGNQGFVQLDGDKEQLNAEDVRYINNERKKRGRGKLGHIRINSCWTCEGEDGMEWLNAWLSLGDGVTGYTSSTVTGLPITWRRPVSEPQKNSGFAVFEERKKKNKKKSQPVVSRPRTP